MRPTRLVLAHLGQYREAKRHLEVSLDSDRPRYGKCVEAEIFLRKDVSQRVTELEPTHDLALKRQKVV